MHTNIMSLFKHFILTTIFLSSVPYSAFVEGQNGTKYQNCSGTFDCGNITNIGYPFWGSNRPNYCGHPKFGLNCSDETADIEIEGLSYRVLEIDSNTSNLRVAREDYIASMCPTPLVNSTLDWQVMSYPKDIQNVSLYYGCPLESSGNVSTAFACNNGAGTIVTGFIVTGDDLLNKTINDYAVSCETKVLVPASQSAIQETRDDLFIALKQGFGVEWDANNSICETCRSSGGVCSYKSSTSEFICQCSDSEQSFTCGRTRPKSGTNSTVKIIIGVTATASTIFVALFGWYCFTRMRRTLRANTEQDNVEAFISNYHSLIPQRYSYSIIKRITNSFTNKLGQGGFGSVYKGKLSDGRHVAVKLLQESIGNGEEFINEVASISRTSHVNIVTLLGFCYEKTKRALVYEYMPNGSLDKFICRDNEGSKFCQLKQKTLFEIAIGIARGLEYLHRGCNTRIVHFDIKPHNILLDQDLCPKIADFGLAKLCKGKGSIVSILGARGTAGYIAPEVFMRGYGGVSYKSDVYSYGMMMLEMFAGKPSMDTGETQTSSDMYFPDCIYRNLERGDIYAHEENTKDGEDIVRKMIIVGLWCIQTDPKNRPSMTRVIEMLEGSNEFLQLPPKPLLCSSARPTETFSEFSSSTICMQSEIEED